jgi:hypothetical protein
MKEWSIPIGAFLLGALIGFVVSTSGQSEMLTVAYNQDYTPEAIIPRETHLVDTVEEVMDICGGSGLKYGCLKSLGKTRQFVCLKSKEFDCKAHEWDHLVRGPRHIGE